MDLQKLTISIHELIVNNTALKYGILVALITFLVTYLVQYRQKSKNNFPPGPIGLPIVGYFPFLKGSAFLQFMELSKKYGEVFSLRLGPQNVVVLNGVDTIKEAFAKIEFAGRPPNTAFDVLERDSPFFRRGVDVWSEHRRFVVHSLKDLGLGHTKIEGQIQEEVSKFIEVVRSYNGRAADLEVPLTPSISNNISSLVFNQRYDYNDPERQKLDLNLKLSTDLLAQTSAHIFFPWMRKIPFFSKYMKFDVGRKAFKELEEIFWKKLKQHEETLDSINIRDFMDRYLIEKKVRQRTNPDTTLSDAALVGSVSDFFGAGSETVKTAILWCVYIMAAYPETQREIQKEIENHLGSGRRPEFMDMKLMPYTHAVMLEMFRWKTVAPFILLRYTLDDTTVGGYDIPKGTTIIGNNWAAHHDPKIWPDPDTFVPERFLSEDRLSVKKSPNFMPFSTGKRICPGESMAYMEVFLYFVSILQNFDISFPKGVVPTWDAKLTVTYRLKPYLIQLTPKI